MRPERERLPRPSARQVLAEACRERSAALLPTRPAWPAGREAPEASGGRGVWRGGRPARPRARAKFRAGWRQPELTLAMETRKCLGTIELSRLPGRHSFSASAPGPQAASLRERPTRDYLQKCSSRDAFVLPLPSGDSRYCCVTEKDVLSE